MRSWKASLRAFQRRTRIRTSRIRVLQGSGLSNTTWFAGFAGDLRQTRAYLAGFGRLWPALALPWFPCVPVYSRIPVFPCIPSEAGCCTFGVSLLLHGSQQCFPAKPERHGIHGNTRNTREYREYRGIPGNTGNTREYSNKARRAVSLLVIRPVGP